MKNLVAILTILTVLTTPALTFAGDPVKVTVRVDGLSCPFCAYGLEKKVQRMEGVRESTINIEGGYVEVIFEEEELFEKGRLEEAVKDAGFTPREVKVEEIKK